MSSRSPIAYGNVFTDLNKKFRDTFKKPKIKLVGNMIAPPITKNYALVGKAFDYLLRFRMEHQYPNYIIKNNQQWEAAGWLTKIDEMSDQELSAKFNVTPSIVRRNLISMVEYEYESCVTNYKKYLHDGTPTKELLRSTLKLAKLGYGATDNIINGDFQKEDDGDIQDLLQLHNSINNKVLHITSRCGLNPSFGEGSDIMGGTAGDLIINDTIVDIKTTMKLELDLEKFYQVLIYYILSTIGGLYGDKKCTPLNSIGIYFSRHGILWSINVNEIASDEVFFEFKKYLINYAEERFWGKQKKEFEDAIKQDPDLLKKYPDLLKGFPKVTGWNYEPLDELKMKDNNQPTLF
jgi:hypothetical protein